MINMDKIVSLAKRRGFVFPSSEIYGGFGGFWDYGPWGVELKNNIKNFWWHEFVHSRDDIFGLDSSIIMNPKIWEASGHTGPGFADPLRECLSCHKRFRGDELSEDKCPVCQGKLSKEKKFNILVKTFIGPIEDETAVAYLRGETAQAIFVNFDNILNTFHPRLPFGIAQIGKAFRNEITPGKFIFRSREFEQMELEYFIYPESDKEQFIYWKEFCLAHLKKLGLKSENLRFYDHPKEKLSHYSKGTTDIEYKFPFGWAEIWGIARRSDFDLKQHSRFSGKDLSFKESDSGEKLLPYVIEPSLGVDRLMFALLSDAYCEEGKRVILKLIPQMAPVKAAVFPLVSNKEVLVKKAREIYSEIKQSLPAVFDGRGNIGKRYYAQDEIGTPWCVTIDYDTLKDDTVTVRNRDTAKQERVDSHKLTGFLKKQLNS